MKRSDRMKTVMKLAIRREQIAVRQLITVRESLDEQSLRLDELDRYRDQYTKQLTVTGNQGLGAMDMRNYRVFVEQLGAAIKQQQVVVEKCQRKFSQHHQEWIRKRTHTQAVEKLIERFKNDEQLSENSREQKLLDEYAMRSGLKFGK